MNNFISKQILKPCSRDNWKENKKTFLQRDIEELRQFLRKLTKKMTGSMASRHVYNTIIDSDRQQKRKDVAISTDDYLKVWEAENRKWLRSQQTKK